MPPLQRVHVVARNIRPLGSFSPSSCSSEPVPSGTRKINKLLVANRGEIAIRIFRAARDLGIRTVAIYTEDDQEALHLRSADEAICLASANGERASYLNKASVFEAVRASGASAVHPGYGFLSEDSAFAEGIQKMGVIWIGPPPQVVDLFGDKVLARAAAIKQKVEVPRGPVDPCSSPAEVRSEMKKLGVEFPIMLKAVHGGGGRGMREVHADKDLDSAFQHCAGEAQAALGESSMFFEELITESRHIEVQVLGDLHGNCVHLFERDCTVQLRRQKVIEFAPAPLLSDTVREKLHSAALRFAQSCGYQSAGTFEFLVSGERVVFIEANPRIQVEHTVTEEAVGVDIVQAQLLMASGLSLRELGLQQESLTVRSVAVQARITMSRAGQIGAYHEPTGRGIRVDSCCYSGYTPPLSYDPLLAKVIVSAPLHPLNGQSPFEQLRLRLRGALEDFHVGGSIQTNLMLLRGLLENETFRSHKVTTSFFDNYIAKQDTSSISENSRSQLLERSFSSVSALAEKTAARALGNDEDEAPEGHIWLRAPLQAQVVAVPAEANQSVNAGQELLVLQAMKMEHGLTVPEQGVIVEVRVKAGSIVEEGQNLILVKLGSSSNASLGGSGTTSKYSEEELNHIRPDLAEVMQRRLYTTDEGRTKYDEAFPGRVEQRRKQGQRTARENIEDLVDPGSFVEYARLLIAQQRRRRSLEDLLKRTPGDGLVAGVATVNSSQFGKARARTVVVSYDYTVLAGTQGMASHMKCDRMIEVASEQKLPMVWFCEGGGGRPGDTDLSGMHGAGLIAKLWLSMGRLSGLVPLVGVTSGYCFAGNAAVLGICDVIIATEGSNIGMGGPAMIEGGGLGVVRPEQVGPVAVQTTNGVIDILVKDEAAAVAMTKKYLSYFQGPLPSSESRCQDQRLLRKVVPENRMRVYDMRVLIETLVDVDSFLELRKSFGLSVITGLCRVGGKTLGIVANNPRHLGGAVDGDAALKAARFLKLCDAFGIPILSLCDTPGFMVGLQSEQDAAVRKVCNLFLTGSSLKVPHMTIITRKGYGLGAQGMAGGMLMGPNNAFCVSWPTGEFGPMGLEGAVQLGFSKELALAKEKGEEEYKKTYDTLLAKMYEHGKAINAAMTLELDEVIDPAESRQWILSVLDREPEEVPKEWVRRRPLVDAW
mmetsp:Transcript_10569/g.23289  ORF Transcript_10569/g.23289 Transcript_10569/m.23289 type:complete len:1162 (-) Transcript_10569:37-3522(-)